MQRPCGFRRAGHVITALHDDAGNVAQLARVADQLAILQPAAMDEIMIFDSGEGEREIIRIMGRRQRRVGQQADRLAFPQAPGAGCG